MTAREYHYLRKKRQLNNVDDDDLFYFRKIGGKVHLVSIPYIPKFKPTDKFVGHHKLDFFPPTINIVR